MPREIKKLDVLLTAANLLGPEGDKENVDPEYERAIVEIVNDLLGYGQEDKEETAKLLRFLAEV